MEHLDFGVRNSLLYHKDVKTTLELTPGSGANTGAVERLLDSQRVPLSELFDSDPDALRGAAKRVRSISYRARRDIDKGAPGTLCVAWGLATWDTGRQAVPAAPIVLRQASVGRIAGTVEDFDLGVSGPWNLNVTLLRLLEVDFDVDVERAALDELVEELSELGDPEALFERVTKMASDVPRFEISPRVVLAPVSRLAMVVRPNVARSASAPADILHVEAVDIGAVDIGAVDIGAVDIGAVDIGAVDIGAVDVGAVDVGADHVGADHVGADHVGADHVGAVDIGDDHEGAGHIGAVHVGAVDVNSQHPATAVEGVAPPEAPEETADTVELFRSGMLNPKQLAEGSLARRIVETSGPDVIIGDITAALRGDGWPESLVEHADSGLRVRDRTELLQRWHDASPHRPRPTGWDATHFALWGLCAAPPVGNPALRSVAGWGERRHHPILMAWQVVAEHRSQGRRHGRHGRKKIVFKSRRVAVPRGMDEALWGLPVDLLVQWAAWVFRQWPGAPMEFVLPAGSGELVSAWYERARPVVELAVGTWVPFARVDAALGKSAHRWVKQLTSACGGGGAPLATWFENSMAVAGEALALRLGDTGANGPLRGRRAKGRPPVEHAV
jgi:hypothetical protein